MINLEFNKNIIVEYNGIKIALDPTRLDSEYTSFISHAHVDHLPRSKLDGDVIASNETIRIASQRGIEIKNQKEPMFNIKMNPSGHILGSRSLYIDEELLYTGDFCTRENIFEQPAKPVKCKTLIVESTYGKPEFIFPPMEQIIEQTHKLISEYFDKGRPVVMLGYPLGRGQILTKIASTWEPLFVHDNINEMNNAYIELGKDLPPNLATYSEAKKNGSLEKNTWIIIATLRSAKSQLLKELKYNYDAALIGFAGWAINPNYKYSMGFDNALPLSDHCDFNELVKYIKECSPEKIYTTHGYTIELASHLRELGFDATSTK